MSMVTCKITTTFPPPTTNSLGSSQRARLLRSTRKLENLLGVIPQVVEPDLLVPATRNATLHEKSKSQSIYLSNPTTSPVVSSINSTECLEPSGLVPVASRSSKNGIARKYSKHKSVHLPRPLLLHLNNDLAVTKPNVRVEHYESSAVQVLTLYPPKIAMPSPLSPLFASEDEPMSPAQVPHGKVRRKRMAKLTRTLGENIPTEFILPHDHLKHQRSPSEPSARSLWPDFDREESEAASMVANNTISTALLPPTINSLGPSQRARLLKSARKLENLLGAIPQVVEPDLPSTTIDKKSKSQNVYISSSINSPECPEPSGLVPTASQNGIARKHSKHKSVHLPRPLSLHLNNASAVAKPNIRIEHSDSAQVLTLLPPAIPTLSPLSPLFPPEDEPVSPAQVPQEKVRRKRMAKLTRTLGENIPTEFVLSHDHLKHQRSPSEPSARSLWPDLDREESEAMSAVTNNTMSTTLPPPTINSLGPSQRARLLKSTRKLGNLLGATPQVEESAVLPPTTTDYTHVAFPVSSPDSAENSKSLDLVPTSLRLSNGSAEKQSKHKSVHLPRPLVIHHNNASAVTKLNVRIEHPSSADSAQVLTLPYTAIATPSPLSPLFTTEGEPVSPMDVPQEKIRRIRMAKLTRTLGENIPPEFIVTHDHLKLSQQHQRSPSEPSPRSLWPDWRKESEGTAALHSFSKGRLRPASVVDNNPTITDATTVPSHRSKPAVIRKLRRRPRSAGPEMVLSSTLFTVTPSTPERPSSPVNLPDSETTEDDDADVIGSDWRGEWNIKDIQERAVALRNLRGH